MAISRLMGLAVLLLPMVAWAQTPAPTCEDRLAVVEALSASKEQMLAQLVAQVRTLQKHVDELKKASEPQEKKP